MLHLTRADWRFCGQWTLVTTIAIALCNPLGPIGLMLGPVVLAIAQGYILKRHRHRFLPWSIATMIGGYVAISLFTGLFLYGVASPVPLQVFLCGAIVGLAQGLVLRHDSRHWLWWPMVNGAILAVSIAWFMPGVLDASVYGTQRPPLTWLGLATLTGLIGGFLKGIALRAFLKFPAS